MNITGRTVKRGFKSIETQLVDIDFNIIQNIIFKGNHLGGVVYIIRNAFTPSIADKVTHDFDELLNKSSGGNRLNDGFVLTSQLGATQFSRNGAEYTKEVIKNNKNLFTLLNKIEEKDIEELFLTKYLETSFINQKYTFRPARYKGMSAAFVTFRRWLDNGDMALMPHEDTAQLKSAEQDGFEINTVKHVISFNACIETAKNGGLLTIWNIQPDDECRIRFGVLSTGYPYDLDSLKAIEKLEINLNPGDVYYMNASHIHGVSSITNGQRLTAGRFIGCINHNEVVYWT